MYMNSCIITPVIYMERLQKIIAQAGICSRRKAEELITQGKVSVNGKGDGTGKIEIEFFSHDDFDRLMEILTRNN